MHLRATSSIIALLATATPVLADVTPAEVWQSWSEYYKASGYTVTEGSRQETGDNLVLNDVVLTMDTPELDLDVSFPQITLAAMGDGRVRTTTGDESKVKAIAHDEGTGDVTIDMTIAHPGTEVISSGTAADLTSATKAPTLKINLDNVVTQDETFANLGALTLTDMTLTEHVVQGDPLKVDVEGATARAELVVNAEGKEEAGGDYKVAGNLVIDSIKTNGSFALPANAMADEDMAAALRAGMKLSGNIQIGPMTGGFDGSGTDAEGKASTGAMKADAKGITLDFDMSQAGLNYQVDSDASNFEITSSDMPMPISYGVESSSASLQMPVSAQEEPQPFKVNYSIAGLTLGDAIWDMFDKEKVLSRDPASLDIDLTGNVRVKQDLFDPALMETAENAAEAPAETPADGAAPTDGAAPADGTAPAADGAEATATAAEEMPSPFEPIDFTINQFALSGAGVNVTAAGNLAAAGEGGMETPVGQINARAEGLNGLLDRLVQIGVVQQEQVGAARMMLAMFTKAGEGPDTLTMDIEFREGGSIFANGQQVK